jgi:TonB family protein
MRLLATGRCELDGVPLLYAVSEYAGELLSEILPERALTPDETREMLGPVIDTLAWLHGKGFVHGHLKPSNILVVDDELKLSADSICRAGAAGAELAAEGIYSAPETAAGTLTPASDVWSLGVTLVETLTQRLPVWDGSAEREPASPAILPQPFAGIARSCLQPDPEMRCTLEQIKGWLAPAEAETVALAGNAAVASPKRQAPENKARDGMPVAAMIGLVVVVVGAAGLLYMRPHGTGASLQTESQQQGPVASGQEKPVAGKPAGTQAPEQAAAADSAPVQEPLPTVAAPEAVERTPETDGAQTTTATAGAVSKRVMPEILPAAQGSIQGKVNVRIRVTVDAAGNVSNAAFESQGRSRYFARAAQDAAWQWKFRSAQPGGQAVVRVWVLEFEFTRAGTEVTPFMVR